MTTSGAIRLYLHLHRHGIPLRALDIGERVTLPIKSSCFACGRMKPIWAPKQKRWKCQCGQAWKLQTFVTGGGGQRRPNPPGERQLEFLAEVGVALEKLDRSQRRLVLLWHDSFALPHVKARWRQTEIAAALRSQPGRIALQYDAAMDVLERELSRIGVVGNTR